MINSVLLPCAAGIKVCGIFVCLLAQGIISSAKFPRLFESDRIVGSNRITTHQGMCGSTVRLTTTVP